MEISAFIILMILQIKSSLFQSYNKGASTLCTSSFWYVFYYCKSLGTLSGFQLSSSGMSNVVMVRCIQQFKDTSLPKYCSNRYVLPGMSFCLPCSSTMWRIDSLRYSCTLNGVDRLPLNMKQDGPMKSWVRTLIYSYLLLLRPSKDA